MCICIHAYNTHRAFRSPAMNTAKSLPVEQRQKYALYIVNVDLLYTPTHRAFTSPAMSTEKSLSLTLRARSTSPTSPLGRLYRVVVISVEKWRSKLV